MSKSILEWLNNEPETVVLQRDNAFAMLTWKDFNQPAEAFINMQTIAWLFILAAGIPVLMMS
ncbi:MAG: hypothetical protein DI585_05870 [Pseudomonas fluorescens]|nr:MAG: hypothetical protein DI585_05870 [Pseudomonas fluorescens]